MAQEPMSHTTGGRPRFGQVQLHRGQAADGRGLVHLVDDGGAAASSVLKRWKLPVRADCRTCSPLAMAVTAKGGEGLQDLSGDHEPLVLQALGGLLGQLAGEGVEQGGGKAVHVADLPAGGLGVVLLDGRAAGVQLLQQGGAQPAGPPGWRTGEEQVASG